MLSTHWNKWTCGKRPPACQDDHCEARPIRTPTTGQNRCTIRQELAIIQGACVCVCVGQIFRPDLKPNETESVFELSSQHTETCTIIICQWSPVLLLADEGVDGLCLDKWNKIKLEQKHYVIVRQFRRHRPSQINMAPIKICCSQLDLLRLCWGNDGVPLKPWCVHLHRPKPVMIHSCTKQVWLARSSRQASLEMREIELQRPQSSQKMSRNLFFLCMCKKNTCILCMATVY